MAIPVAVVRMVIVPVVFFLYLLTRLMCFSLLFK